MPGGDGTGPGGMGPMTGRAAGFCAGYPAPGYANPVGGRGYWGGGRGRGRRRGYYATGLPGWARAGAGYPIQSDGLVGPYGSFTPAVPPEQEFAVLKQQAEYFRNTLDQVNKRIEQLETERKD